MNNPDIEEGVCVLCATVKKALRWIEELMRSQALAIMKPAAAEAIASKCGLFSATLSGNVPAGHM
jgi:hypothetical protein